jgi:AmmeMemoRadiSam system protein A
MEPMHSPSTSSSLEFTPAEQEMLLQLARESIIHGLIVERPLHIDFNHYPSHLQEKLACFVTLNLEGNLRGCIGHLEATQPLVKDVVENAFSAAFRDPRFPQLSESEMISLEIDISILSPSKPIEFASERDLLIQLRPGEDGLILKHGVHQGTFLPSVWETLPDAESFLNHLKRKAGLDTDFWSNDILVMRYTTESFSDNGVMQTTTMQ